MIIRLLFLTIVLLIEPVAIHEPGGANLYFPYEPLFSKVENGGSFLVFGGLKVEIWSLPGSKSGVVCLRSTQLRQGRPFFDGLPRKTLEGPYGC